MKTTNTTNYVEFSFRMTKDVQFSRLKAYNLTDLLSICLDESKLYTRRCIDVSHNRNYHLFTNQKSKYLYKKTKIDPNEIIQLSEFEYLVPSENIKDCTLASASLFFVLSTNHRRASIYLLHSDWSIRRPRPPP